MLANSITIELKENNFLNIIVDLPPNNGDDGFTLSYLTRDLDYIVKLYKSDCIITLAQIGTQNEDQKAKCSSD